MQFKQTLLALAIGVTAMSAHAATGVLNNGDLLTITPGVGTFDSYGNLTGVTSGSYFAMSGKAAALLAPGSLGGIVIGQTTLPGASHSGLPAVGDKGYIDAPWGFYSNTGTDYTTTPITGSTAAGLNFSGWTVTWNGIAAIPMGTGAFGTGYTNGVANFTWDGVYGDSYTLSYHATVPTGDPSGFGGVKYGLTLTGTVVAAPVPEASTYGMMVVGLGLVGAAVMRRRKV